MPFIILNAFVLCWCNSGLSGNAERALRDLQIMEQFGAPELVSERLQTLRQLA